MLPERYRSLEGFLTPQELKIIQKSVILLAGCGAGSNPNFLLARYSFGTQDEGKIIFADPENVDECNLLRQSYDEEDLGVNKAEASARHAVRINNLVRTEVHPEGITAENVSSLISQSDVVFEMVDVGAPDISFLIHLASQEHARPAVVTLDLGDNTLTRVFRNDIQGQMSYLQFLGLTHSVTANDSKDFNPYAVVAQLIIGPNNYHPLETIKDAKDYFSERFFQLAYDTGTNLDRLSEELPEDMRPVVEDLLAGKLTHLPQTGIAGQLTGAVHVKIAQDILLNRPVYGAEHSIKVYLSELVSS